MRAMQIMNHTVVALTWTLKDSLGELLDELTEPVEFLVGGEDLLPRIEQALMGKREGESVELYLEPEDGFGDYDADLVFLEPRSLFPEELEEGMVFEGNGLPQGASSDIPPHTLLTVTELYPEHVVLDANHPLAGIALKIALRIHRIRPSTEAEQHQASAGTGFFKIAPSLPEGQEPPLLH